MRTALILAAGQSRRMKSERAKVVHPIGGRPMIEHVVGAARAAGVERVLVVIGHGAEDVRAVLDGQVEFVWQEQQKGTGHAVLQAAAALAGEEDVLLLYGDTPLLQADTLAGLMADHRRDGAAATLLTAVVAAPAGYGRIKRAADGRVVRIVEEADAAPVDKAINEINTGIACYKVAELLTALADVRPDNNQGEYYLVDVVPLLAAAGGRVGAVVAADARQFLNVNDRRTQAEAEGLLRRLVLERVMDGGVTIVDPGTTYIDDTVTVGPDSTILPFTIVTGASAIGRGCTIGPGAVLHDVQVEDGCRIVQSNISASRLGAGSTVGPYSHLRPGTVLAAGAKVGNFAEIKNSTVGPGSKVSHHSYIGDSRLGADVNIGAGTVTVNYDGAKKHTTIIHDKAFIGCNANLIAPVVIGADSYVAAGSTIGGDVPDGALAIARGRQENKPGWVERRRAAQAQQPEKEEQ